MRHSFFPSSRVAAQPRIEGRGAGPCHGGRPAYPPDRGPDPGTPAPPRHFDRSEAERRNLVPVGGRFLRCAALRAAPVEMTWGRGGGPSIRPLRQAQGRLSGPVRDEENARTSSRVAANDTSSVLPGPVPPSSFRPERSGAEKSRARGGWRSFDTPPSGATRDEGKGSASSRVAAQPRIEGRAGGPLVISTGAKRSGEISCPWGEDFSAAPRCARLRSKRRGGGAAYRGTHLAKS